MENQQQGERPTHQNRVYTVTEVMDLMAKANISMSAFYRAVRQGDITKYLPEGRQKGATYNRAQVDAFVQGAGPSGKRRQKLTGRFAQSPTEGAVRAAAAVDWLVQEDLPYVYVMNTETRGLEQALPPDIIRGWQDKNPMTCQVLFNQKDRRDIWGALAILPLSEETIFRLLRGEMAPREITPEQVLAYEAGQRYSCYAGFAAIRPARQPHFLQLVRHQLQRWCDLAPGALIHNLYAAAPENEEGPVWDMVRELYFSPRYDIGDGRDAWELRLDYRNPAPAVQEYQLCLQQRRAQQEGNNPMVTMAVSQRARGRLSTRFVLATPSEIPATIDIDEAIFGPVPIAKEDAVRLRLGWREKEPAIFHVLKAGNEVVGYHAMVALPREKIEKILREEQHPRHITPEEIIPFQEGQPPLDVYVIVTGVRPGFAKPEKGTLAASLIRGVIRIFQEFGRKGIVIGTLYGRSRTPDGIKMLEDMGFTELPYSPVHEKRLFSLDVATCEASFVQPYKHALEARSPLSVPH